MVVVYVGGYKNYDNMALVSTNFVLVCKQFQKGSIVHLVIFMEITIDNIVCKLVFFVRNSIVSS